MPRARTAKPATPTADVKHRHAFYARLKAIGAEFCPTCNMFPTHAPCRVFDIMESLTAFGDYARLERDVWAAPDEVAA